MCEWKPPSCSLYTFLCNVNFGGTPHDIKCKNEGSLLQDYSERKDDDSTHLTLPHDWIPTSARHWTVRNLQVMTHFFLLFKIYLCFKR